MGAGEVIDVLLSLACVLLIAVGLHELIRVFRRNHAAREKLLAEIEERHQARKARGP